MATYISTAKNLVIIKDKVIVKFAGGRYETGDKAVMKVIESYAKAIPEANIKEIKGGE